jgi:hypothetical protein
MVGSRVEWRDNLTLAESTGCYPVAHRIFNEVALRATGTFLAARPHRNLQIQFEATPL